MSIILGLHLGHDGSACIVKDGKLITALSLERVTRAKKTHGISDELLSIVFGEVGIDQTGVDAIALSDYNEVYSQGAIKVREEGGDHVGLTWNTFFGSNYAKYIATIRGRDIPAYNIGHHMSHCAAAYYTSPFKKSWCMSMDSSGGYTGSNFLIAKGDGLKLEPHEDWRHCLVGLAYGEFTEKLCLGSQMFKAGSLMALASYGNVLRHVEQNIEKHCNASFQFEHPNGDYRRWVAELWDEVTGNAHFEPHEKDSDRAKHIAASIQYIFEKCILHALSTLDATKDSNLCLGGGSFLNCNANSAVLRESQFQNVHLFPAATDDGCAVGAALYVAHHILGEVRAKYTDAEISYLGPKRDVCDGVNRGDSAISAETIGRVAEALVNGKIVAWCNGRSEYGPRALGHRSILADPRVFSHRDKINFELKKREWFRPVCPSVLEEKSKDWFDFSIKSPFMLFTASCKQPEVVPSAVHVDGSARMQTVSRAMNPQFYDLISEFEKITKIPMLLNTSLNVDGEPIVESRNDVQRFWENVPVDCAVVDGEVWAR